MARAGKRKHVEAKLVADTWGSRKSLPNKKKKSQSAQNLYREDGSVGNSKEKEEIKANFLKKVLWVKKSGEIPKILENLILENADSWLMKPFEVTELRWATRRLKNKKSDKPFGISNEEWKAVMKSRLTRDMILLLFNRVLQSKAFIEEWEQSEFFCLFKKGDNKDPENYRLVAVLDIHFTKFCRA